VFVANQAEEGGAIKLSGLSTGRLEALFFKENEAKKKDSVIQMSGSSGELGLIFLGKENVIQDDEEDNEDSWEDLNCNMKDVNGWGSVDVGDADDGLSFWGISLSSMAVTVTDSFCNFASSRRRYIAVCSCEPHPHPSLPLPTLTRAARRSSFLRHGAQHSILLRRLQFRRQRHRPLRSP
jgi:hypothetical protein